MNRVQRMKSELFDILHPNIKVSVDRLGSIILRSSDEDIMEAICANLYIPDLVVTKTKYGNYQLWLHTQYVDEMLGEEYERL